MKSLFSRLYHDSSAVEEEQSFGGVTATDFFGLLMVSMFTLTLLVALTLGTTGSIETQSSVAKGGESTEKDGQKSTQAYYEIHIELMIVDKYENGKANPAENPKVVLQRESTEVVFDIYNDYNFPNHNGTLLKRKSAYYWRHSELVSHLSSNTRLQATINDIPVKRDEVGETDLRRYIESYLNGEDFEQVPTIRQIIYQWSQADADALSTALEAVLPETLLGEAMEEFLLGHVLVHLRTLANGSWLDRYYLSPRNEAQQSFIIDLKQGS